jgi:hypothetical protein
MSLLIYALCTLTSAVCAALLLRGYRASGQRLLLWSGLCFIGFALNNALLILDARAVLVDFSTWPTVPALAGVALLLYGLIWETR